MRRVVPRAFTLLETIVGIAIGLALLAAVALFTANLGEARERLARMAARIECADAVFEAIDRALATAVVEAAGGTPGVAGTERLLRIERAGVGLGDASPLLADLESIEIGYDGASRIAITRGGESDALEADVRAMRIRYLATDGWADAFDSVRSGGFPAAIEVSIWFGSNEGGDASDAADDIARESTTIGPPDRRRLFRVFGAPRVDPLAARSVREERTP